MCGGFPSGIIQTSIFCTRNFGKTVSGKDPGRIGATLGQAVSVTDSVASSSSIFGEGIANGASKALSYADDGVMAIADKLGKTEELAGLAVENGAKSTVGAIARKAVNPLLCVAAGVRILKDDDQYAALIEEGSAMGLMFGAEKLMKTQRGNFYKLAEGADDVIKAMAENGGVKKIVADAAKKFKGLSSGKQTAIKVGLELLFVAGSITAYAVGKNIGKKLSHRDEQAQPKLAPNA